MWATIIIFPEYVLRLSVECPGPDGHTVVLASKLTILFGSWGVFWIVFFGPQLRPAQNTGSPTAINKC